MEELRVPMERQSSGDCRLSKYHSQKPESTRKRIFNRDSTLQLIVQISSGNVNSSVRARAKTHGRIPVSIELPRVRHLGSDACISRPRRLHLLAYNARIYIAQECTARGSRRLHLLVQEHDPRHACTKKIHAPQLACARRRVHLSLAHVQKMPAPASYACSRDTRVAASYACVQNLHAPS